jgi:hypothetical protein
MAHMQLIFCSAKPSPDHLGDGKVLIANGGREGNDASRRLQPDTIIYTNFFFSFIFSIDALLGKWFKCLWENKSHYSLMWPNTQFNKEVLLVSFICGNCVSCLSLSQVLSAYKNLSWLLTKRVNHKGLWTILTWLLLWLCNSCPAH